VTGIRPTKYMFSYFHQPQS